MKNHSENQLTTLNYRTDSEDDGVCVTCAFYNADRSCELLDSEIDPLATCDEWEAMDGYDEYWATDEDPNPDREGKAIHVSTHGEKDEADIHQDDATPAKRILKWKDYEIGLQYFQFDRRHNRILPCAYGHLRRTKGSDGLAVDSYLGPNLESDRVFEVTQLVNGQFDELKMMIGFNDVQSALNAYLQAMPESFFGGIREISMEELAKYRVNEETKADDEQQPESDSPQQQPKVDEIQPIAVSGEPLNEEEFQAIVEEIDILQILENILEDK